MTWRRSCEDALFRHDGSSFIPNTTGLGLHPGFLHFALNPCGAVVAWRGLEGGEGRALSLRASRWLDRDRSRSGCDWLGLVHAGYRGPQERAYWRQFNLELEQAFSSAAVVLFVIDDGLCTVDFRA